ncbi:MAG: TonB-dependent siderophore receptor [Burkholderiaceae bacterium]
MTFQKRPTPWRLTPLATALMLCAANSPAHSQVVADASEPTQLDKVEINGRQDKGDVRTDSTTIGKTPTLLRDVPQTITVINRAMLGSQGATSLSDALRSVPGITIGAAEGGQIGNNINLRGFTARTDIFIDGVRDRGQYYRDTFFIETIEVLKGPSSMLFGRGSTGGVINQVSKQAHLGPLNEASVTVGTRDQYRAVIDTNQPMSDTSAFRISAMGQNVQTTRDVMTNEDYGIAPTARFGIDTPTTVTVSGLFQHNHDMADYGISALDGKPAPVAYDNFYGLTDDRIIQDASVVGVKVEHRFSDQLTLRNQTQYDRVAIDARETNSARVGTFVPSSVPGGGAFTILPTAAAGYYTSVPLLSLYVLLQGKDKAIVDDSLYNQTDLIANFETGFVKHTLITGFELGRDTYQNQSITRVDPAIDGPAATTGLAVVSLEQPTYAPSSTRTVRTNGNLVTSNADSIAAYANDTVEFTPEWKLVGGLRFDRYRAVLNNTIPTATLPSDVGQNVTFTSVRAGATWQPSKSQSYYVSYGTSFNPSLEQLTVAAGQQTLGPEKNKSYEAGAKFDLVDDKLSITGAAFRIEKENARTQISTGVYELDGNIVVEGAELGITGYVSPSWQVFGGYTFLDARLVQASALDGTQGKVPANTPRHSATLWTTYMIGHAWELGTGLTYLGKRFASNTDVVTADAFTRWDGTIAYHMPKYDVRFNLLNITNKDYISALIPSDGGRSVPGAGRTALLTLTTRF